MQKAILITAAAVGMAAGEEMLPLANGQLVFGCTTDGSSLNFQFPMWATKGVISRAPYPGWGAGVLFNCSGTLQVEAPPGTRLVGIAPDAFSDFKTNVDETGVADISLYFSGTSITDVPAYSFNNSDFTKISFDDNPMTGTIHVDAFKGTTALAEVSFARTELEDVPITAINGIPDITKVAIGLGENLMMSLPNGVFDGLTVRELALDSNNIKSIDTTMFKGLTTENLVLSNNKITSIGDGAFTEGNSIGGLDFSYAGMTPATLKGLFVGNDALKSIALNGNNLNDGTQGLFDGLNLDKLFLSGANMTSFDASSLNCTVKELDLKRNKIGTVENIFGDSYPSLETLWLEKCDLTAVDANAFKGLSGLKNLHLSSNAELSESVLGEGRMDGLTLDILALNECNLTSVSDWLSQVSVKQLILSKNKISTIATAAFATHKDLTLLKLDDNMLSSIPRAIFDGHANLKELDFSNNVDLSSVDDVFRNFQMLDSLSLAYCGLSEITAKTFSNLMVKNLDVSYNSIDEVTLPKLGIANLESLNLRNNQIKVFPTAFFEGLDNLVNLDLTKNEIITVKAGQFSAMKKLKELTFEGNSGLTAIEKNAFAGLHLNTLLFDSCPLKELKNGTFDNLTVGYLSFYEMGELTGFEPGTFTNVVVDKLEFGDCPFTNNTLPQVENEHLTQFVFATCQLNNIPDNYFQKLPKVIRIIQDDNDFPLMKKNWYNGSSLIYIQSQFVNAEAFEEGFFEVANQLTGIVHNFNNFVDINDKTFVGASALLYNTFYNNSVYSVSPDAYNGKVNPAFRMYHDHDVKCENIPGVFRFFGNASNSAGSFNKREDNFIMCATSEGEHIKVPSATNLYTFPMKFPNIKSELTAMEESNIIADVKAKIMASGIDAKRIFSITIHALPETRRRNTAGIEVRTVIVGAGETQEVSAEEVTAIAAVTLTVDDKQVAQSDPLTAAPVPESGEADACDILNITCCSKEVSTDETKFYAYDTTSAESQCKLCDVVEGCRVYRDCECIACETTGWSEEGKPSGNRTVEDKYPNGTTYEKMEYHEGDLVCINLEQKAQSDGLDTKDKIIIGVCCSVGAVIIIICIVFFAMKTKAKRDKLGGMTPSEFVNGGAQSAEALDQGAEYEKGGKKGEKKKDEAMPDDGYVTPIVQ